MKDPKVLVTLTALMSAWSLACGKPGATEKQKEQQASDEVRAMTIEAQQQVARVHAEAEKSVSAARADFETTRENYLHTRKLDLIDLDRRIADLEVASSSDTRKAADMRARLSDIYPRRDAFSRHLGTVAAAPSATWDAATKQLDQEWDALRRAVDAAG